MAAADSLLTLFAFETQIESAVAAVLEAAGVPTIRQRSNSTLATPRVEVKLHLGASTTHRYGPPGAKSSPGQTYPAGWNSQLVLTVVTNRTVAAGNADRHDELVAKCRVAMLQATLSLNEALEYLSVQNVSDVGVIPNVHADEKLDLSPLVFSVLFWIKREAWPVAVTG